jgi:hypothetical protein
VDLTLRLPIGGHDAATVMRKGLSATLDDIKEGNEARASYSGSDDTVKVKSIDNVQPFTSSTPHRFAVLIGCQHTGLKGGGCRRRCASVQPRNREAGHLAAASRERTGCAYLVSAAFSAFSPAFSAAAPAVAAALPARNRPPAHLGQQRGIPVPPSS